MGLDKQLKIWNNNSMAARKRSSSRSSSKANKDLLAFVVIVAIVAVITYVLTYNAIMAKVDSYMAPDVSTSTDYQLAPPVGQ